jgi:hypothetical protein
MKNLLSFLLITLAFNAFGQDEIFFKSTYLPNTTYTQKIVNKTESKITLSGSDEVMKKLAERGMQNPVIRNEEKENRIVMQTGKLKNGRFPLTMNFVQVGEGKSALPSGTIIHGYCQENSLPVLDSISSSTLDASFKTALLKTIKSLISQIQLPQKMVKVGEQFEIKTPIKLPIGEKPVEVVTNTIYKLIQITGNNAIFELTQTYSMNGDAIGATMVGTAKGSGKGKLTYNFVKFYNEYYELDAELFVTVHSPMITIDLASKTNQKHTISITN